MDKDTKISSSNLYHYTDSLENLINILRNGFRVRYSLEKLRIFDNSTTNLTDEFAFPMVCFCDIPLNLVENHIKWYGEYAIGLKKSWGEEQAICPIMYLTEKSDTRFILETIVKNFTKNNLNISEIVKLHKNSHYEKTMIDVINLYDNIIDLIMFVKPYKGFYERLQKHLKEKDYKFYDEREWRYKPSKWLLNKSYLTKDEFLSQSPVERNKNLKEICFEKNHIVDIIVPNKDIEKVRNELKKIKRLEDLDPQIVNTLKKRITKTNLS